MKWRITACIAALLLLSGFLNGQKLLQSRKKSHYIYYYRITEQQAFQILRSPYHVRGWMHSLQSPVDSVPFADTLTLAQKQKWGYGHYIGMYADGNWIQFLYVQHQKTEAVALNNRRDLMIRLFEMPGKNLLTDADVKLSGRTVPLKKDAGAYVIRKANARGILQVRSGGEVTYFDLRRARNNPWIRRAARSFIYRPPVSYLWLPLVNAFRFRRYRQEPLGYMMTNKPKYLPGDTVKMKAYLVHPGGRPYSNAADLYLVNNRTGTSVQLISGLRPVTKGAYVHEFVLGDSLTLDENYSLILDIGNALGKRHDFRLEDYQLDEVKYVIRSEKPLFYKGDTIRMIAAGTDANGHIISDGRVKVTVKSAFVKSYTGDTLFVKRVLWEREFPLNPADSTYIIFPAEHVPAANISLSVQAVFNNSNNETHDTSFNFSYADAYREIETRLAGGAVTAVYKENGKTFPAQGSYELSASENYSEAHETKFPCTIQNVQNWSSIRFRVNDVQRVLDLSAEAHGVSVSGIRTKDSVLFRVHNPNRLNFICTVLKGGTKIAEQKAGNDFTWSRRDKTRSSYRLECQFIWAGKEQIIVANAALTDKNLTVELVQPEKVHPGQTADVTIRVRDYKGRPVSGTNLTALAVNRQFGNYTPPSLPYMGKSRLREKYINSFTISKYFREAWYGSIGLDSARYRQMRLDTILYYKMLYPEQGYYEFYDSTREDNAQVSVFLVNRGHILATYMMLMDGRLFYYYDSEQSAGRYVCTGNEGYHTVQLRTWDALYTVDSVFLRKGMKLDVSIDVNDLPRHVRSAPREPYLDRGEMDMLRKSMLFIKQSGYLSSYFWQRDRIYNVTNSYYNSNRRYRDHLMVGPVMTDSLFAYDRYRNPSLVALKFEHGYSYDFLNPVKMYSNDFFTRGDENYRKRKGYPLFYRYLPPPAFGQFSITSRELRSYLYPLLSPYPVPSRCSSGSPDGSAYTVRTDIDAPVFILWNMDQLWDVYTCSLSQVPMSENTAYVRAGMYYIIFPGSDGKIYIRDSVHVRPEGTYYDVVLKQDIQKKRLRVRDNLPVMTVTSMLRGPGVLEGVVQDAAGVPLPLLNVTLSDTANSYSKSRFTLTGVKGNFHVEGLPDAVYRLKIYSGKHTYYDTVLTIKGTRVLPVKLKADRKTIIANWSEEKRGGRVELYSMISRVPGVDSEMSIMEMVEVRSVSLENIFVQGSRSVTEVFIDGVKVRSGLFDKNKETLFRVLQDSIAPEPSDITASVIRSKFSDYAYWQPNLITDKNGEATFRVKFPDNITGWECYALAMNGHKQSGTGSVFTQAYKDIASTLSMPRFMIAGDEATVIGKTVNHTGTEKPVRTEFVLEGATVWTNDTTINEGLVSRYTLTAGSGDSLKLTYRCFVDDYSDGEERSAPVFRKGTMEATGHFWKLRNDTAFSVQMSHTEGEYYISATDNLLLSLLEDVEDVKNYPYACMEQTASRLKALLSEKMICRWAGRKFTDEEMLRKMLRRLEKYQKTDGSWGWWENSPSSVRMTVYITEALGMAAKLGYTTPAEKKGRDYLERQLSSLTGYELLSALNVLSGKAPNVRFETFVQELEKTLGSARGITYEKLQLLRIRQLNGLPYDLKMLDTTANQTVMGSRYWGTQSNHWYDNSIQYTLLAYKILETHDSLGRQLEPVREYFLEMRAANQWVNTVQKASVLETILPALLRTRGDRVKPVSLKLSGTIDKEISKFPFTFKTTKPEMSLTVSKSGTGPAHLSIYEKKWNEDAGASASQFFSISTGFFAGGKKVEELHPGAETELVVNLEVKASAEFVMIGIPIPAGCSYGDNALIAGAHEVHREYFKDKVSIFCETLPKGSYTFKVRLEPRFAGKYTMNPAKAELMYFPTFYGRNEIKKVMIK